MGGARIRSRGCWVARKNASSVLRSPPMIYLMSTRFSVEICFEMVLIISSTVSNIFLVFDSAVFRSTSSKVDEFKSRRSRHRPSAHELAV